MTSFECLTWNIHRCRGRDGIIDPERTMTVLIDLLETSPVDLLVLTEAEEERRPFGAILDLDRIMGETGLSTGHADPSLLWGDDSHGFLGTIILHGPRLIPQGGHVVDLPGHCPRGAAVLTFHCEERPIRIIGTHLSLGQPARIAQMRTIGQFLARQAPMPAVLLGDLNEWRPWGGLAFSRKIAGQDFSGPVRRSFPASLPFLPLDRALATVPARVADARVLTSPALRETSDHLPLWARVTLD